MVTLRALFRGGGFGVGVLPEAGGVMDQSALMLDAFAWMERVSAWIKQRGLTEPVG